MSRSRGRELAVTNDKALGAVRVLARLAKRINLSILVCVLKCMYFCQDSVKMAALIFDTVARVELRFATQ